MYVCQFLLFRLLRKSTSAYAVMFIHKLEHIHKVRRHTNSLTRTHIRAHTNPHLRAHTNPHIRVHKNPHTYVKQFSKTLIVSAIFYGVILIHKAYGIYLTIKNIALFADLRHIFTKPIKYTNIMLPMFCKICTNYMG